MDLLISRECSLAEQVLAAVRSGCFLHAPDAVQGAMADTLLESLDDCLPRFNTVAVLGGAGLEVVR